MSGDILEILVFASIIAGFVAFFLVLFFGLAMLFEKERRPQWFKILVWGVVILFLNFMSCSYLIGYQFGAWDTLGVR
jgi:H+/Cl- antiporter ClcA